MDMLQLGHLRGAAPLGFLNWRERVNWGTLKSDLPAGLTNAAVVLPQGVAFASIAGLPPEYGLYTAIVTPVVAALFGSSMIMVSGPTTAMSAVIFASLSPIHTPGSALYVSTALVLTLLVGLIQLSLGLLRVGRLAAFVSHSVLVGFTAAAAILIGVSQLRGALGVDAAAGGTVVDRLRNVIGAASQGIDWRAAAVAAVTALATLVAARIDKRLPGYLIGLAVGTMCALALGGGLPTIGSLPSVLPQFAPPIPHVAQIVELTQSAIALALIGLLEAIAIGRSLAQRTDTPFSVNQEIVAQGLSNVVGSMFQSYAGSGSFTRSGLNLDSGAKTPLSAIFASLGLVIALFAIAPLLKYIPIAAISGLIILVAIRLVKASEIRHIIMSSRTEALILLVTFAIGILVELDLAIFMGVILSLGAFIQRTMKPKFAVGAPDPSLARRTFRNAEYYNLTECPQMMVCRFDGPLYFGSSEMLEAEFERIAFERPEQKVIVVNLKGVGDIDLAGVDTIIKEARRRRRSGGDLYVIARAVYFLDRLKRLGLNAVLGEDHILTDKHSAITKIVPTLSLPKCQQCTARIFFECADRT